MNIFRRKPKTLVDKKLLEIFSEDIKKVIYNPNETEVVFENRKVCEIRTRSNYGRGAVYEYISPAIPRNLVFSWEEAPSRFVRNLIHRKLMEKI